MYIYLTAVLLHGTRRHNSFIHSFKESKEKTTLIDKGVRLDPWVFISWSLVDRKSSHKTVQVTCTLVVPRWGESRRPVPTAASVAAVELGPCQAAGELSPALPTRTRRFARHSRQGCASSSRLLRDTQTSTDCKFQRTTPTRSPRAAGSTNSPDSDLHTRPTRLALCVPLYPSWLLAPPCFQLPREASRRGVFGSVPLVPHLVRSRTFFYFALPRENSNRDRLGLVVVSQPSILFTRSDGYRGGSC